jgi:hypothetical protein
MRPADMLALINTHAAQALRLEDYVTRQAGGVVKAARNSIIQQAARLWHTSEPRKAVDTLALGMVATPPPNPTAVLLDGAERALKMGLRQAAWSLGLRTPTRATLAARTADVARDVETRLRRRWDDAYRLLITREIRSFSDVVTAVAPIGAGVGDAESGARWITNTALNQGLSDSAAHHKTSLIWFSERDACLTCLALAGEVVEWDEDFDSSLTFDRHPQAWFSLGPLRPPRHPRCRCRAEPYRPEDWDEDAAGMSLVALLKRDAERAVLRGWAGASEPRRLDAADRLLATGSVLPKHVQDIARAAIERGHFIGKVA